MHQAYLAKILRNKGLYVGDSRLIKESTSNTAQIGFSAKTASEPSLIISDPVKFSSASLPRMMPMITPGTLISHLCMTKPMIPAATMIHTSHRELA